MKSVDEMVDYVRQLRLHAQGRRAIHVHLSRLEKHFREEHYRRFVAVTLRSLITNFGATMFALPNNDVVLIVKDARVESIDPLLNHIRRKFRDSALIQKLDPVQGESDLFVSWFEIEEDYPGFRKYIEQLADDIAQGTTETAPSALASELISQATSLQEAELKSNLKPKPDKKKKAKKSTIRMVPIEAPRYEIQQRELDPELIVALNKALLGADVSSMLRRQQVMAIIGDQQPQPVMVHRFVPTAVIFDKLMDSQVYSQNRWLKGYLKDLLASRVLYATPNMQNDNFIASSLHISAAAALDSPAFDRFDRSLGAQPRSTIILEFGIIDVMANFGAYHSVQEKMETLGYRVMIGGLDPRALLWLDYRNFDADFVKLKLPDTNMDKWLDTATEDALRQRITQIGTARVILSGCNSAQQVDFGHRLGVHLFQGTAISPVTR